MMFDVSAPAVALLVLATLVFGCFAWGTVRHFVWEGGGSRGAWVVSMLSWVAFLLFVGAVLRRPPSGAWPLACVLFIGAQAIWSWALLTTRRRPPTLAFTEDDPKHLYAEGPYRWIRHPFYTAYLTFWVGTALTTLSLPCFVAMLVLAAIYLTAARHEEAKFARSALSAAYRGYAARTGMFLPRLGGTAVVIE